jgi:hypothetical protein
MRRVALMDLAHALWPVGALLWTAYVCRALARPDSRGQFVAASAVLGALVVTVEAMLSGDAGAALGAGATVIGPALVLLKMSPSSPAKSSPAALPKPRASWTVRLTLERSPKPSRTEEVRAWTGDERSYSP